MGTDLPPCWPHRPWIQIYHLVDCIDTFKTFCIFFSLCWTFLFVSGLHPHCRTCHGGERRSAGLLLSGQTDADQNGYTAVPHHRAGGWPSASLTFLFGNGADRNQSPCFSLMTCFCSTPSFFVVVRLYQSSIVLDCISPASFPCGCLRPHFFFSKIMLKRALSLSVPLLPPSPRSVCLCVCVRERERECVF